MTNGEKIKELFPDIVTDCREMYVFALIKNESAHFSEEWWNAEYKEPTTKNDLVQERYQDLIEYFGDEKVAKIILENRGQFKAWLERLRWHVKRADELARELEQLKGTTKNDLGVDCISRKQAVETIQRYGVGCFDADEFSPEECERFVIDKLNKLPSVSIHNSTKCTDKCIDKDKLRAEIDKIYEREGSSFDCLNALDELKEFIDKYKEESESEI